jgi:DNA-directed RNA polymerase subunit RPC12/RpoP
MVHQGAKEPFYCERCDTTFLFRGNESPGHKEDEEVRCPDCRTALGWLRCDVNPPALVQRLAGKHENPMEI